MKAMVIYESQRFENKRWTTTFTGKKSKCQAYINADKFCGWKTRMIKVKTTISDL